MSEENFEKVIIKARDALVLVEGQESANNHFADLGKNPSDLGGRPGKDYRLTRHAAYLTAMAADDTKDAVARARIYFARRTEEAEVFAQVRKNSSDQAEYHFPIRGSDPWPRVEGVPAGQRHFTQMRNMVSIGSGPSARWTTTASPGTSMVSLGSKPCGGGPGTHNLGTRLLLIEDVHLSPDVSAGHVHGPHNVRTMLVVIQQSDDVVSVTLAEALGDVGGDREGPTVLSLAPPPLMAGPPR